MSTRHVVRIGFMPLLDAASLVAARAIGFAEAEGVDLELVRESSWANIRDRLAVGHFDAAHLLAPAAIAAALDLMPIPLELVAPMSLGVGGNAITVSDAVAAAMRAAGWAGGHDAHAAGRALGAAIRARGVGTPLSLGVVHPHSGHNYELRYWLAASGIDPERDVDIVVLPPPLMPDALAAGHLDGFCAGEPWGTIAVRLARATVVTTKSAIWRGGPDKVLAVTAAWADADPERLDAVLRALYRAALWCAEPGNHGELARLLARPEHVDCEPSALAPALAGRLDGAETADPGFFRVHAHGANVPRLADARWFYSQMVRWGHVAPSADDAARIEALYRPDLLGRALEGLDEASADRARIAWAGRADEVAEGFFDRGAARAPAGEAANPEAHR